MSGTRGEASSGLQHLAGRFNPSTAVMTRVSNGPPSEGKSLAELIHSSTLNTRKRKLASSGEDTGSRRKRIASYKTVRLKRIQQDYVDHVTEVLTLESASANVMEGYSRKCPDIPSYLNYFKNHPLDPSDQGEDLITLIQSGVTSSPSIPQPASQGVSLFSVPEPDGSSTASASSPDKRLLSPLKSPATNNNNNNRSVTPQTSFDTQEQIVEKAKQEAHVMQRINELQREGLWAEKRLPKVQEPPRVKAHWDYLLEEMVWLAADFAQERKWKKAAAKKCAKMVQKYFQDKELMAQKAVKSQEMQLKRIASTMAKEVKQFWANVEKLVEYKQQTRLEEKRKKALDQHLSFIVDQTEKYSTLVAESMNKTGADTSLPPSPSGQHHTSDVEFEPGGDSTDDEETIAKAEAEDEKELDKAQEIALLQQESELPLDELLKDYMDNRDKIVLEEEDDDTSSVDKDEEFRASDKDTSDDEETIQEQERAEGKVDHKQELDDLKAEGEMEIDELKAKYANLPTNGTPMDTESQTSETTGEGEVEEEDGDDEGSDSSEEEDVDMEEVEEEIPSQGLSSLLTEDATGQANDKDKRDAEINDVAALAESIQPKGNTLSSTSVVTKIPFLLKHSLREYQHIGLDWLVTMYDRKLNGILADEMGLGKTIQTISVLAHLACEKGNWGPHLIVVPTSVMLNWEMEFKKWCPAFKILTYYGTQKERKMKRTGWTKPNAFHVCITSYKLVIQDHQSFRRKSWKYLILDEAQNIKNFKSQRWQLLLNFQTQRRLLLTGTPLQNNLMELWSLMHFLMPNVFQSHREFKEWFSNPVTGMIEGNSEYNEQIIKRLHKVLRPFLLRRLKCEVEKQLPKKYEHVVMCRLSNRQRYLYDDFMSRAKTRETLATGNLLSVINVLMQLRKVCNHPNLFEVRPTVSPFQMEAIELFTASCVWTALDYNPFKHVSLEYLQLWKADLELWLSAFMAHQTQKLHCPARLIEEIDSAPPSPPPCPRGNIKLHVNFNHQPVNKQVTVRPGAVVSAAGVSAAGVSAAGVLRPRLGPTSLVRTALTNHAITQGLSLRVPGHQPGQLQSYAVQLVQHVAGNNRGVAGQRISVPAGFAQLVNTSNGQQHVLFSPSPPTATGFSTATAVMTSVGQRLILGSGALTRLTVPASSSPAPSAFTPTATSSAPGTVTAVNSILVTSPPAVNAVPATSSPGAVTRARRKLDTHTTTNSAFTISRLEEKRRKWRGEKLVSLGEVNEQRCVAEPMYGWDLVTALRLVEPLSASASSALRQMILGVEDRLGQLHDLIDKFVLYVPAVKAPRTRFHVSHPPAWRLERERRLESSLDTALSPGAVCLHPIVAAMMTQFPDPSLIQYDCGKLQSLDRLLRQLKSGQHRVLIFTQMTKMLDVLEAFLNFHGHIYLRLDGTTKVDQRQVLMERFNADKRIFCFILSTRSGGVGVNLTGADTVVFYDSDWNPTMDAQAQDRCHRIGQTRDVHIYRLVSEKTVEENILKKANQKRMLGDLAIEGGNFTTAYFKSTTIQDLFNVDVSENDATRRMAEVLERRGSKTRDPDVVPEDVQKGDEKAVLGVLESAMAAAEDDTDVAAAKCAKAEAVADLAEFDETIPLDQDAETGEEISKAEQELNTLVQQLSGVEKYAMRFIEETEAAYTAEQLAAAEAEIEQQKREWEEERLAALRLQEELAEREASDASEELLTYAREDAQNQVWVSQDAREQMPMWCPLTPPVDDSDVYIDHSMCFLYESTTMSEAQLPPVHVKKERKRTRLESNSEGRHPVKVRSQHREELTLMHAPRSLFDRPSPALVKMRHDLRLEKYRGSRSYVNYPLSPLAKPLSAPPLEPDNTPEWIIHEDWALLQAVQCVQELTLNLVVVCPGHTPNWEMVADMVNMVSRIYRSPRQCRNRYEYTIIPREEGKMMMDSKKLKKTKGIYKIPQTKCSRPMRTSQMYLQDNNTTLTQVMNAKFECIRHISNKRTPTMKPVLNNKPDMKNPKHAEVLSGCGIDYDKPMSPVDVAVKRADRISKEKQLAAALIRSQLGVNKTIIATTASPPSTSAKAFTPAVVAAVPEPGPAPPAVATTAPTPVTATVPAKVITNNKLSPAQMQMYQQRQALLRQQQLKAAALQGRTTLTGQKVSVAVTSPTQARLQQVKQATGSVTRVSETEMAALMKRQTAVASVANVASVASVAVANKTAAILAQAGLQTQQGTGQVAALVKTASGQHLPISIPQVKAALPGVKATTATPQQIRQLQLQNQLLAQQRSKLTGQKVAQLGQVMVTNNKGVPAQLIVQSQKSVSTPMTMQQMQQIIKHVHPQHLVSASGQTVQVSQGTSTGQVISHTVIAKSQGQTRVIPQQNIKQTIQVVTASPGVRTSVPNVTIDSAGRPTVSVASQIKVTSQAQQQALINQVLQQGQQITVRHPLRLQAAGTSAPLVAVAVTQAPTLLTISHPPPDNTQNQ